jgi:archaellum component FlaF (FlaF/FlaG flagellin family)
MARNLYSLSLAAVVVMTGAMGAAAATIDFTDNGSYTFTPAAATGTTDGIGWTLDSTPNTSVLTNSQAYDGDAAPATSLALENDGIGVLLTTEVDDEVTFPAESLTMTFDTAASVTGFYFLDLFGDETVTIYADGDLVTPLTIVSATSAAFDNSIGGYTYYALDATVTSLTFVPGNLNDNAGNPDFALAAIDLAAVPVPAAGLLLLTALAGLGLARRRKTA